MKTFWHTCAQGEALFRRVDAAPTGAAEVAPEGGRLILAHSETGHHHVMDAAAATLWTLPADHPAPAGVQILYLIVREPTTLEHLRPFDTHEPILFEPGVYEVRRQREYAPEGYRRVED